MWTCFIACIQFLLFNLLCEPGALDSNTPILPTLPCHHPGIILFHVIVLDQLYLMRCISVSCLRKINHPPKVLDLPVTYRKFQGHLQPIETPPCTFFILFNDSFLNTDNSVSIRNSKPPSLMPVYVIRAVLRSLPPPTAAAQQVFIL